MNYDLIKLFYGWHVLTPAIDWYVQNGFIDADQYKEITGDDYVAPTAQAPTTQAPLTSSHSAG